jgi:hypothetical protein
MKTELRAAPSRERPGRTVFEVWHDGRFLGAIYGCEDRAAIRLVSAHTLLEQHYVSGGDAPNVLDVRFGR